MKKFFLLITVFVSIDFVVLANEPDSVYLFSYATEKNNNHNGLHFAWSVDKISWHGIGNEFSYLKSDYGRWGAEKRMITPYVTQGPGGVWQCVWSLNEKDKVFAHASSHDLIDWGRQSYPDTKTGANVLRPVLWYDKATSSYTITYTDVAGKYYRVATKDFKIYGSATEVPAAEYKNASVTIPLPTGNTTGQLYHVPWEVVDKLIKAADLQQYKSKLYSESAKDDAVRFADLQPVNASITMRHTATGKTNETRIEIRHHLR